MYDSFLTGELETTRTPSYVDLDYPARSEIHLILKMDIKNPDQ